MLPNEEWAAYLLTRRARYRVLTMALENTYELLVRGLPVPCKRCGRDGMAIALIHPDFEEPDYLAAVTADGELVLAFAKELLVQARHTTLAGTIKYRRDPHVGGRHLSCGCARCDGLFDPDDLALAVAEVLKRGEVDSLPVLARVPRTVGEWALLAELSKTSLFNGY